MEFDILQQRAIAKSRSGNPEFGNIDDVIEKYGPRLPYQMMLVVSLGRGNNPEYGSVDKVVKNDELMRYNPGQLTLLSKGLGNNPDYNDVSMYAPEVYCFNKMRKLAHRESRPQTDLMPYVAED